MIIQNIPQSLLSIFESSNVAFSDNSRFIYLAPRNSNILVYDNKHNKYITLKPHANITDYLKTIKGFKKRNMYLHNPSINVVNEKALLLLYDFDFFEYYTGGNGYSALILLVKLDFSNKAYLMVDKKIYKHCYYANLSKDGLQYALTHISMVDTPFEEGNEYRCILLKIDENQIYQTQTDPIIIDYDFLSLVSRPTKLYFYDDKIWFLRDVDTVLPRISPYIHREYLSYFDLNEPAPVKETVVQLLQVTNFLSVL
uniref:Uncharacterized protein n=1 Tax=Panagrolaimus sp. ES5 TaxID=591445 RepID=A0AC34G1Q7_9BILA